MENKSEVRGEDQPFFVDTFIKLLNLYDKEEMFLSEVVEKLNVSAHKWAESHSVELREENARLREALEKIEQHFKDHGWKSHEAMNIASEALNQIKKEESTPPEQPGEDQKGKQDFDEITYGGHKH